MKIAHILNMPFTAHGGLTLLAREIALGLSGEYETSVLCPKPNSPKADIPGGLQNVSLIEWDSDENSLSIERIVRRTLDDLDIRVAFVHGGDFSWGPLKSRISIINKISSKNRRIILINHQSNPVFSRLPTGKRQGAISFLRSFTRFTIAWFLKHIQLLATDLEIAVSGFEFRQAKRRYFLFRKKFRLIYHSRLPSSPDEDALAVKRNIILSVGHFAYRKGQHVLLRAFGRVAKSFPSWTLQLVGASGENDYRSLVKSIIEDYQIQDQVEIVTETHQPDKYFRHASIYVQPSLVEAYGLAVQEAMHFGCACVGANAGGIPDSVTDPEYQFPAGDDEKLSVILRRLMNDQTLLAHRMNHDFKESARLQRNRETMLSEYRSVIEELTSH